LNLLFISDRYLGNEESEVTHGSKSQEEDILQRLRKEAQLRLKSKQDDIKRKRSTSSDDEGNQFYDCVLYFMHQVVATSAVCN